jgi:hypothetical protein
MMKSKEGRREERRSMGLICSSVQSPRIGQWKSMMKKKEEGGMGEMTYGFE